MDTQLQTSFIPKQSVHTPSSPSTPSSSGGLFTTITFIILFLAIVFTGGAYGYRYYLHYTLYRPCSAQEQSLQPNTDLPIDVKAVDSSCGLYMGLERDRRELNPALLENIQRLDQKFQLASDLLDKHMTLVPLFDLLSTSTLKTIRYTKFEMKDGVITLSGTASGYDDVAVQAKVLNEVKSLEDSRWSDLTLDQKGNVTFKLKFKVDPDFLLYSSPLANTGL